METIQDGAAWTQSPFDSVLPSHRRCAYGMPYVQLDDSTGGQLWITRDGWPFLTHLDPARWFLEDQYFKIGQRLSGGSGTVYRVPTIGKIVRGAKLVVKVSRMAQDVPLQVSSQFPDDVSRDHIDCTVFNDPFQEFGVLNSLRSSPLGPPGLRILTKQPLAIYSPAKRFPMWQLGRTESLFRRHQSMLAKDQRSRPNEQAIEISIDRRYICLYHWVRGVDAQTLLQRGVLTEPEAAGLVKRAVSDLAAKGFRMLDIKPGHLVLRVRRNGSLLKRGGQIAYLLVDFELLQRTGK